MPNRPSALILVAHDPDQDPRIGWVAEALSKDFDVCEIGIHDQRAPEELPTLRRVGATRLQVRTHRNLHRDAIGLQVDGSALAMSGGISGLLFLRFLAFGPARAVMESVGGTDKDGKARAFQDLAKYIYDTNLALIDAGGRTGGADLIVAADFDTLPAAAVLARRLGCPAVYDAHEYWPHAFPQFSPWEIRAWSALERLFVQDTALRITVSDPLAAALSEEYGLAFQSVPNAVPLEQVAALAQPKHEDRPDEVVFLYQGGFAEQRGVELLIDIWDKTDSNCILHLRGPASLFKDELAARAAATGLLGTRILFPDPVRETELVEAAAAADVGLISYEPTSLNHIFCCPNKLSQYMAAGLPILANDLVFVRSQVEAGDCGVCVSYRDTPALLGAIHRLSRDAQERRAMGTRGRRHFEQSFNWERVVAPFAARAKELVQGWPQHGQMDFSWIEAADAQDAEVIARRFAFRLEKLNLFTDELQRVTRALGDMRKMSRYRISIASRSRSVVANAREGELRDLRPRLKEFISRGKTKSESNRRLIAEIAPLRERLQAGATILADLDEARIATENSSRSLAESSVFFSEWAKAHSQFDLNLEARRLERMLLDGPKEFARFCNDYRSIHRAIGMVVDPQGRDAYASVAEVESFSRFTLERNEAEAKLAGIYDALSLEQGSEFQRQERYVALLREALAPFETPRLFQTQCARRVELARVLPANARHLVIGWHAKLARAVASPLQGWRRYAAVVLLATARVLSSIPMLSYIPVSRIVAIPDGAAGILAGVREMERRHREFARERAAGRGGAEESAKDRAFAAFLDDKLAAV